ncbi:hypothetical protein N802_06755 [Knoellia sinensis KCTC 19936]|uniref:Uncharacterized protein n=1 Tax=Knoellia sinensis KCTC 19936 TaxID=1385520 RepID=A0A0A0IZE4_9MICO|nr:hypothetical protein [Knoellia sinensis]KGN30510.1 hypothetical protein N802_06755 [Knoellia sinensis KCTC 19936]
MSDTQQYAQQNPYGQQPPQPPMQPGQWQPVNPPAPPVKQQNWFMRHKILTGILGLFLFGIMASALGGGGDTPSAASSEPTTATSSAPPAAAAPAAPAAPAEPEVDPDDVGNEANPVTIVEGKAFDVRKFSYAAGWKVSSNSFGMEITNLKVTNNRGERDGAFVQIKYMKGTEVLATIDCNSDQILPGQTVTLSCFSTDKKPKGFDKVTINDTF